MPIPVTVGRRSIFVALVLMAAAGLVPLWLVAGGTRVYAQGSPGRIPDLRGNWAFQFRLSAFENTKDPNDTPGFGEIPGPVTVCVLVQNIEVFAGWFNETADKMTGVISDDGTVYLQVNDGHSRYFLQGKLSFTRNELKLVGTYYGYEDLVLSTHSSMHSGSFTARRLP